MPGFQIYQVSKYIKFVNMLEFWKYQSFEYAIVLNIQPIVSKKFYESHKNG